MYIISMYVFIHNFVCVYIHLHIHGSTLFSTVARPFVSIAALVLAVIEVPATFIRI